MVVFFVFLSFLFSQQELVDGVLAVVGDQSVLFSEVLSESRMFAEQKGIKPETSPLLFQDVFDKVLKDKIYLQADEATAKLVEGNLKVAMETIAKFPNTPAGLLRARQAFDKVLNEQLAGKAFDPKVINANNESLNAVRNAINDLIQARVVSSGVDVKKSLSEQHKLWNAQNILDQLKALREKTFISSIDLALAGMGVKADNQTLDLIMLGIEERVSTLPYITVDPRFANYINDEIINCIETRKM